MIEVVWDFLVREQVRGQFELAFGPGGTWGEMFGQCSGFRGMTLLRATEEGRRYLAIELWDTESQRQQAVDGLQSAYAGLMADLEDLTESRTEVGVFRVLTQATVRPHRSTGPRTTTGPRRGGRRRAR
jgi:heme-degrading monooxygenase HmoA